MKKKLSSSISVFISSIIVLLLMPGSSLRTLSMYLRHYGLNKNLFKYFWRSSPSDLMLMLISVFLLLIAVISFVKILYYSARIRSPQAMKASPKHVTEEAINCEHTTGKAKYIEQIDGYLRTGLIDRAEYNELKARYERLNIPDDYHG